MKKNVNIRSLIIIILCLTIILLGIGFILLANKLNAKNNEEQIFAVEITKVEASTAVKGGAFSPVGTKEITNSGKSVNFNFTLYAPKDELAYTITIANTGNIKARLIDVIDSPNYIKDERNKDLIYPVTITHSSIKNKVLSPGDTATVKVIVNYGMSKESKQVTIPYQLSILATSKN